MYDDCISDAEWDEADRQIKMAKETIVGEPCPVCGGVMSRWDEEGYGVCGDCRWSDEPHVITQVQAIEAQRSHDGAWTMAAFYAERERQKARDRAEKARFRGLRAKFSMGLDRERPGGFVVEVTDLGCWGAVTHARTVVLRFGDRAAYNAAVKATYRAPDRDTLLANLAELKAAQALRDAAFQAGLRAGAVR